MWNVLFPTLPMRPDGVRFTPVGARVGFELPKAGVDPDTDARRQPFARAVHFPDLGGRPVRGAPHAGPGARR